MAQRGIDLVRSVKDVSRETEERLTVFHDLLKTWQAKINLISPNTVDQIWERHIADSVQLAPFVENARTLVDLGSGAGFPGIVLAILMAEGGDSDAAAIRVDLIESAGKKCAFLNTLARETGLKQAGVEVLVHHGRIEQTLPGLPTPDLISARALASLKDLITLSFDKLQAGSLGLFPKGRDHIAEIAQARESFDFTLESMPSRFGQDSVILQISDVHRR